MKGWIHRKHLAEHRADEKLQRQGGGREDKGSIQELVWGLERGTALNKPQIRKGPRGEAGTLGFEGGLFSVRTAPQHCLGAEHAGSK